MSGLRDEIRAILREEIAALTAQAPVAAGPVRERVQIASSAELNRFVRDLIARAADPEFAAQVTKGEILFELAAHVHTTGSIVSSTPKESPNVIDKPLVTERDIAAMTGGAQTLRLGRTSRLTPLARDEARRRGIRIERSET